MNFKGKVYINDGEQNDIRLGNENIKTRISDNIFNIERINIFAALNPLFTQTL